MQEHYHERVELLKRAFEAASLLDYKEYFALLQPDVEVHDPSRPDPVSADGVYRGQDAVRRYFDDWMESFEEFRVVPREFTELGGKVLVRVHASGRARASGLEIQNERFYVFDFRDRKVAGWGIYEDEASAREAGASAT